MGQMTTDSQRVGVFYFGMTTQQFETTIEEVGSKAFNMMRMSRIGLPVPPGFVLGTSFCAEYLHIHSLPSGLIDLIRTGINQLEKSTGLTFGGKRKPMLLSIRSGAAISMPGMMDTILNVGLSNSTVDGLVRVTGNPRFAWDSYRRLIQTYAEVVRGCSSKSFDKLAREYLDSEKLESIRDLDSLMLKKLCSDYFDIFLRQTGDPFPQDPIDQLTGAVEAVFNSWEGKRATEYRRIHKITGLAGTAVLIQLMVFGNMGASSGSGVAFTRDPSTGENRPYIDFLFNAQGEDVVSGTHNVRLTEDLSEMLPDVYRKIQIVRGKLETEFRDMQDFEFTVQEGVLYVLQSRRGARTPWAAIQIAVDLVNEGIMDHSTALKSLEEYDLSKIERTVLLSESDLSPMCRGLPASAGVAVGVIVLDAETAKRDEGSLQILVRNEISPNDVAGLALCSGIITNSGARNSHAAVVARQMNKVCIVGCRVLSIDLENRSCSFGGRVLQEGDWISIDGNTGMVFEGKVKVSTEKPTRLLEIVNKWEQGEK